MSTVIDLEAQQVGQVMPHAGLGRAEMHEMDSLGPHTSSLASILPPVSRGQDTDDEAEWQFVDLPSEGSSGSDVPEMNIDQSHNRDDIGGITMDLSINDWVRPPTAGSPSIGSVDIKSEEPRMIGDFDGSANEFWKLYRDEAKSHDDARISTLKEGMDSALIFAGLFSAALTAFVVDSKQNLKPSPSDETIYYLRQHSAILSQISLQLSSIAPQVPIPSTPPPPFPPFSPLSSDVRVNVFWFMALTFSLLAALLAILVQQWVRNYMHVFQRYGDPLKSSRLRQFLYEGCEKWNMPRVAEVVPGFLHVSLFLFFGGLGDSLLNINTKVALSTIVPIGVSVLLYIFTIFAPIIYPQSPYQNIFSGVFWYFLQKSRGRRFKDHSDGKMKPVSGNMAQGQMQLAMEETAARKDRDVGATRWLINNLTEDAEMEKFLLAIPGSFNTDWGEQVWNRVGEHHKSEDQGQDESVALTRRDTAAHRPPSSWNTRVIRPIIQLVRKPTARRPPTHVTIRDVRPHLTTTHIQGENIVYDLSTRVARSVGICKNRGLATRDSDSWRIRSRTCIEATASLVFCANAKLAWFGGISNLLGDIGKVEKIRELSLAGTDQLFVMRWTCLSLMAIRPNLSDKYMMAPYLVMKMADKLAAINEGGNRDPLAAVQKIDKAFVRAGACLIELRQELLGVETEELTEQVIQIVRSHKSTISKLEHINIEADRLLSADRYISDVQTQFYFDTYGIISQFPGVDDDFNVDQLDPAPIPFSRLVERSIDHRRLQFIHPGQILKSMCSPALTFRNILEGQGDVDAYIELNRSLRRLPPFVSWHGDLMTRQLWRMEDLTHGRGFGFTVELFFFALSQLLSKSSSTESHSVLYTGTFRAITSDWSKRKHLLGTQKLILAIAVSRLEDFGERYPAYIVDEFLSLLSNIFEGETGPHIDEAREEIILNRFWGISSFANEVSRILTREQTQSSTSSYGIQHFMQP